MGRDVRASVTTPRRRRGRDACRVSYWTGIWEPRREAISKEVAWLRSALDPRAIVVSFTPQRTRLLLREKVLRLNFRRWLSLRSAALALERTGDVTHVFGGVGSVGHFLHVLGRRPILMTAVIPGGPLAPELYARVARFVVESRGLAATLTGAGVPADRIDIIYPPIDLQQYSPQVSPPAGRFRLLFASSPSEPGEIDQRGVGLLIDLARLRPEIDIIVAWRRWGRVADARSIVASRMPPSNFKVEEGDQADMCAIYRGVHATVCCFEAGYGKAAPNSLVEGLASGLPALVSDSCGIADLIGEWQAGVVTPRSAEALATGLDDLQRRYDAIRGAARRLAEAEFDSRRAASRYAGLYRALTKVD
jgi:glycosyltransferase involved in cell wall biosynthesis